MAQVLKNKEIPQLESWGLLVALFALEFIAYLIFYFSRKAFFPSLPIDFLDFGVKVFTYLSIFLFCMIRYGKITFEEFLPTRKDILLLSISVVIILWIFGLFIGPERIRNPRHEIFKSFVPLYYWLSLFIVVGLAPFFEEAIFRRYFLEIQHQHYSTSTSVLITAGVATLFHFDSSENLIAILLWTFFIQTVFGLLYVKGRLVVSVLAHMFVNGLVMLLSK